MTQTITNSALKLMLNRTFKSTPDYGVPSKIKVGTGTTNPSASDTDLETSVDITAGVETKDFTSGFPILDETNLQVRMRATLNTLEANGNNLTEFGIFNTDSTPLMWSRTVHTPINKTASVQISYLEVDKL